MKVRTPLADSEHDGIIVVGVICSYNDDGGSWNVGDILGDKIR
jgi:hypothetical protein